MLLRWTAMLLVLSMAGCVATSTGAVRGGGVENEATVIFAASPLRVPVYVSDEELNAFMWARGRRISFEEFQAFMDEMGVHVQVASYSKEGRVLLASWEPAAQEALDPGVRDYLRWCQPLDRCISLPGDGRSFGPEARRAVALNVALRSVWPGIVKALRGMLDIQQIELMVVSSAAVYLTLLAAPEPVSKFVAAKLTYLLLGSLGASALWNLMDGWRELEREVVAAHSFEEVRSAGERFGERMGAQVARALVMLVTLRLGGKIDGAISEMQLPGGPAAAEMMAVEGGGVGLSATGAVRSVALGEGRAVVAFSSGEAVATGRPAAREGKESAQKEARPQQRPSRNGQKVPVVVQTGEEEEDCRWHHIATDKNEDSDARGGPWTPRFERVFALAGMDLNDPANLICVVGHKGPHPMEYHQEVLRRLADAVQMCHGIDQCRQALTTELRDLAREISTPGSALNHLVTRSAAR